jgi:hypothetical protein
MYNLHSILKEGNAPIFLSINIQSLNSKYEELRQIILELEIKNIPIDIIAIQETWEIQMPDSLILPGFQTIVYKNRANMRGVGIGFYVRNGINFKIMENLSPFEPKILETITLQVVYPNRPTPFLLTCAYRSNGPLVNVTVNQQMERFLNLFEDLLHNLSHSRLESYVFIDSNIDLLNLHKDDSSNYINAILSHGFLQCTMKSTRMQQNSKTLIDQILSFSKNTNIYSGTIISDLSDHFFTFIRPNFSKQKCKEKTATIRSFSQFNLNNFKAALGGTDWSVVTDIRDVNNA